MKLIAAVTADYGIGKNNDLLIKSKSDLSHFKMLTMHKVCIMGFNTFKSLPECHGEKLPERKCLVITGVDRKKEAYVRSFNAQPITSINRFFIEQYKDAFVIGGATLWHSLYPYIDEMYITHIDTIVDADCYFPTILQPHETKWEKKVIKEITEDNLNFKFCKYVRKAEI